MAQVGNRSEQEFFAFLDRLVLVLHLQQSHATRRQFDTGQRLLGLRVGVGDPDQRRAKDPRTAFAALGVASHPEKILAHTGRDLGPRAHQVDDAQAGFQQAAAGNRCSGTDPGVLGETAALHRDHFVAFARRDRVRAPGITV